MQIDTLDVQVLPGVRLKQFTARDVISRWDVLDIHTGATAATASSFLQHLSAHTPFPISAIHVAGGAEVHGAFEQCHLPDQAVRAAAAFTQPNGSVESA